MTNACGRYIDVMIVLTEMQNIESGTKLHRSGKLPTGISVCEN